MLFRSTTKNRSYYVNAKLTKETNLSSAVTTSWQGLLLVVAGTNCYVADNRQGDYRWYFWTNIPACVFMPIADALYFGTADGYICRFNSDTDRMDRYSDGGSMTSGTISGGVKIFAQWATKLDSLGYITMRKTMLKKGSGIMIKPFTRSSVSVKIKTDAMEKTEIASGTMDRFDFDDIRFDRFTFNASDTPQTISFNTKIKKFINIQFVFENDVLDEGFGILGAQIQYVRGQYVK